MSTDTIYAPANKVNRQDILRTEDSFIDYLDNFNPNTFFLFTAGILGSKVANFLLTRIKKDYKVNEEEVKYWMDMIKRGEFYSYGGHSTIHIDKQGYLIDWQEKLCAIARSGIVERSECLHANIHFGIFPWQSSVIKSMEVPKVGTRIEVPTKKESPKPEYIMKYPYRYIALIMAYDNGTLEFQTDPEYQGGKKIKEVATVEWCKKNDNALLSQAVGTSVHLNKLSNKFLSPAEWDALKYITSKVDTNDSTIFFTMLKNGDGLGKDHPITSLRNAFTGSIAQNDRKASHRMRMVLQAWNAFREGLKGQVAWDFISEYPKAK